MSFADYDRSAAAAQLMILGETVSYHTHGGLVRTIQALVDRDVESYSGDFDSSTNDVRHRVTVLASDAPNIKAGELIVDGSEAFELCERLSAPGAVVVTYTARLKDGGS